MDIQRSQLSIFVLTYTLSFTHTRSRLCYSRSHWLLLLLSFFCSQPRWAQTGAELLRLAFFGYHVPRALTKTLKQTGDVGCRWMIWGDWMKFIVSAKSLNLKLCTSIHYCPKFYYSSLIHQLLNTHSQCQIWWIIWGISGPFIFLAILFCHPSEGRDSPKIARIPEECGDKGNLVWGWPT